MSKIRTLLSVHWLVTIGASFAAVLGAAYLFSSPLQSLLSSEAVKGIDRAAWQLGQSQLSPALWTAIQAVSDVHGTVGILVLTAACAWGWRRYGHLDACVRLLVAVPAGMLLNVFVKAAVHRVRPDWALVELPHSFSFPSGHVAEATVFYGSLAMEAAALNLRRPRKVAIALGAVAMIAIVACSRIVLGVHFFSDCVGAFLEGALWLGACFSRRPMKSSPASGGDR
jgi:undecaprenyl-diphosphatase